MPLFHQQTIHDLILLRAHSSLSEYGKSRIKIKLKKEMEVERKISNLTPFP
jgi:hypothetical protein